MKRVLLASLIVLSACAAAPQAPVAPIPPRQLSDIPADAPGQFGTCTGGTQVAMMQWSVGERVYRIIVAPEQGKWVLISPSEGTVWYGSIAADGTLTVDGTLPLEAAKTRYPDPCLLLHDAI